jgi:hypothetical protein
VSWTMADTAMWEVAKRRADALRRDRAAGSRLTLEAILDEIRLRGPDAFEMACCRSLLRVFAADSAEREGLTIDGDRLHDAVAEFKISRSLEYDTDLARFLADNELSPEDFERLVVTDEMVRWACEQAQLETFGSLLDDLRLNGDYPQLVTRAKAKLEDQERPGAPADSVRAGQAAIRWYFAQRRGTAVPDDLAGYARSCGFPDEQAFRAAVWREYWYVRPD